MKWITAVSDFYIMTSRNMDPAFYYGGKSGLYVSVYLYHVVKGIKVFIVNLIITFCRKYLKRGQDLNLCDS